MSPGPPGFIKKGIVWKGMERKGKHRKGFANPNIKTFINLTIDILVNLLSPHAILEQL